MSVEKKVPEIRFKEFSREWENKKIGRILTEIKRPIELMDNTSYQLVTVKRRNEGIVPRAVLKGKNILVKNYFSVEAGDYLISKRQVVHGANGIVPDNLDGAVVSNEYLVVTDSDDITARYWTVISIRPEMHKLFFISSYGVDIEKLVFDVTDWKNRTIFIPQVTEQKNITDYFQKLDSLIAQHQKKHDKLSSIKKAMLEKMFPKQSKTIPEIRFKGFSGVWEEKMLGTDIAEIIGGGTPSTSISEFWDGDIDWYSPTEIGENVYAEGSQKKITPLGLKSCSAKILPAGNTVLFTSRAGIGDMAILTKPGSTNQGFQSLIVKGGYSPYFIFSAGKQIKDFALKHASGSTFLEISGKQLGRMKILMPSLEEQTAIGNYFKKLDNLINQYQQQITKLNKIKQACLSKMFI
ncbi:restriction endonuclease subunit S [Serratia marcescens]|uniref:Restriction endonuclease subunit S n=2 Tax=Serratia TaxID=613 RepID=A0ABD5BMJ8_SERMA|nr:restriction endonuclease subunit S [Serratia marcescens]AUU09841.1 restriction endonuclease subunit S [Serratia marcescens]MCZ6926329.1 restriction endonuclease subunit S [Serratia marcescens]MDE5235199.1 restriction endonuclease subunit S [Serratia marcescens]MDE5258857.1 restriction endonuclease subunit S [Serratia marcescens]MDQ9378003.1 restriction endonuclease subunit S [Serratia marcescens]